MAWYGGEHGDRCLVVTCSPGPMRRFTGACCLQLRAAAGALVSAVRRSVPAVVAICDPDQRRHVARAHSHHLEHALARLCRPLWRLFHPTFWDWMLLFAPLGLFVFFFLCFVRLCRRYRCTICASFATRSASHDKAVRRRIRDSRQLVGAAWQLKTMATAAGCLHAVPRAPNSTSILAVESSRYSACDAGRRRRHGGARLLAAMVQCCRRLSAQRWRTAAAIAGPYSCSSFRGRHACRRVERLVAFLWTCRLPRLLSSGFRHAGFERATQDRFFLLASQTSRGRTAATSLRQLLKQRARSAVSEMLASMTRPASLLVIVPSRRGLRRPVDDPAESV